MMIGYILLGVALLAFGVAQALQLMGRIGTKLCSQPGAGFDILGWVGAVTCFQKAGRKANAKEW